MSAFLDVNGLRLALSEGFVLGDLSLSLERGERLVVLGPSGCGKTTLLRCLCGLASLDAGRISVAGRDVTRLPPERRDVGYVPQAPTLFPNLDVAGNVAFGLRATRVARAERERRVGQALDLLRIAHLAGRRPPTLSGGEGKRVALARSLVLSPAVLLLDEPLAMLDGPARDEMVDVLRDTLAATRTTTVHVTHDREEAWSLAGRCAVMERGRIREVGPIEDLFLRPRHGSTARFLGAGNVLPARFPDPAHALVCSARLLLSAPAGGADGFVVVRPTDLVLVAGSEGADFEGTLDGPVVDRGAYASLRVRLSDGVRLLAHVPPASARGLSPPARVHLASRAPVHPLLEP